MSVAEKRDYYEVLGVDRDADQRTIKRAFLKKARTVHPDVSDDVLHRTPLWWRRGGARFVSGFANALFYAVIMFWFVSCSSGLYYRPYFYM